MRKGLVLGVAVSLAASISWAGASSPKWMKPKIKDFNIAPVDFSGGTNVREATAAVETAISKVRREIRDQKRLLSKNGSMIARAHREKMMVLRNKRANERALQNMQHELEVLEGLEHPSSAIQQAIEQLKQDIEKAKEQIRKAEQALRKINAKLSFLSQVRKDASANLKKLSTALDYLEKAKTALVGIRLPRLPVILRTDLGKDLRNGATPAQKKSVMPPFRQFRFVPPRPAGNK